MVSIYEIYVEIREWRLKNNEYKKEKKKNNTSNFMYGTLKNWVCGKVNAYVYVDEIVWTLNLNTHL